MSRVDLYLLLTAIIWGSNYSVIKFVLQDVPSRAFNVLRLLIASAVFLLVIATRRRVQLARLTGRDWAIVVLLGVVGQFLYQLLFIEGLERTSVVNASIIIAWTPAAVSLVSAAVGHERLPWRHWAGTALSFVGVTLIVRGGAAAGVSSPLGDLMMVGCVACWTVYTVAGRPLLATHSPLVMTGLSMAVGTVLFVPTALGDLARTQWTEVRPVMWVWVVFSSLLALNFSYTAWYLGVRQLGASRTSLYSNVVPVAALVVAMAWLGERLVGLRLAGAMLVLAGVVLTRWRTRLPDTGPPAET
ncbi:MAG: DMT family transporter [Acidobacteria bacterium]|nr:DMT family transporter [Acidobacteriota bacterium]